MEAFGQHLFARFSLMYPAFFEHITHSFEFLKNIDPYIQVEVRKLYPDAELPRFYHHPPDDSTLVMYYLSSRHFEDLAVVLIKGCLQLYERTGMVSKELATLRAKKLLKLA
ncbi:hypothetical protein GCM10009114_27760 [Aliiglaciecola litoralis]|uniref:Heme NO-binding domain-containing protein n=1 Tax=Aliiglaciecola litoralis TaxID=582857 RepID=A0ABN1LP73_9ALTE